MAKRVLTIVLIATVAVFLTRFVASVVQIDSFAAQLNGSNSTELEKKHVIFIAQQYDNPFWKQMSQGAHDVAQQYNMEIQYVGPSTNNVQDQLKLLQKAIASSPDAIIAQGVEEPEYIDLIARASAKNIPVVTVDMDAPQSQRIAYIGTDHQLAGQQMAELILEQVDNKAQIGVIIGSEQASNQILRLEAFQERLAVQPFINIVDIRSSNISKLEAAKQTVEMMNTYPEISIIVGFSGLDAIGIVEGLQSIEKNNVTVYGFDNLSTTKQLLSERLIQASIVQQPVEIGRQAIITLNEYFNHGDIQMKQYITTTVVTN
ncbi:substrate-binding domain-containing protein [Paenibacillus endoradicis]|uniref:substrate-binding domain-containing protein n=1 Tax=Paenibacillus endoradicis TaxID=2972487 RepID=UPI002158CB2E|nr:substrate-binding domain-containing protein [Paenibacillus endoradicis]MCR8658821.1 substrate-binding domain-containing protein [Paenibacillus endoradicis]